MIRQIRGKVLAVAPTSAVIEVSGFGMEVHLSGVESLHVGEEALLATHLVLKQDGLELYGFSAAADRDFFDETVEVATVVVVLTITSLCFVNDFNLFPTSTLSGFICLTELKYCAASFIFPCCSYKVPNAYKALL